MEKSTTVRLLERRLDLKEEELARAEAEMAVVGGVRALAFARLATALQKHEHHSSLSEMDLERAKGAAAIIGGNMPALINAFTTPGLRDQDKQHFFEEVLVILRTHQRSIGGRISDLNRRRALLGRASGKLGRLLAKGRQTGAKLKGPLPEKWIAKASDIAPAKKGPKPIAPKKGKKGKKEE